ncbi:AMP-binding protein [Frankia sp. Cr1]|uniref:AMP-binding protein n=1 Tax=Frankia sp. Cr1 TaxID=3073931 RepID=UPI002AD37269|nr:AMP-binding protein [Frankia sp. Cr1]
MPDYGLGSWPARRARINGADVALRQHTEPAEHSEPGKPGEHSEHSEQSADRSLTYAELAARVERLSLAFAELGVGHGDRVAYLGPNDIATFEVFFATARLGAIFVPFNTRLAADEVAYLLDDARPTVLVYGPELADLVVAVDPAAHGVAAVVPVAGSGPGSYAALLHAAAGAGAGHCVVRSEVALSDDAVILYTSGTTGRPKGAVLSHANMTFNTMNQLAHVDVLTSDVALCMAPLFHAAGLGQVSLPTLFKGGTVVVAPRFDPGYVLSAIAALRIASFSAVPTMLQMLCEHPDFAAADLSSLRFVIYGGSTVAERVAVAWQRRGVPLLQGYGMTEASPGVYLAVPQGAAARPISIGVPHFFTDVSLAAGADEPEPGTSGELLVRGLNVFRGYWNRPAETDRAFTDGWFRSGDVVRVAQDGWAYVVDRLTDVIISGGENVYPVEVEAVLNALPGVVDAAVVGVADDRWGEVGFAFVIADPDAWTEESLRAALRGRLASFKIPKYVLFVPVLPRTATGKVRKQDLRATAAGAATAAGTPTFH